MPTAASQAHPRAYRHDALFYDGPDEFHTSVSAFVDAAVAAGAPVLVVASAEKIDRLRPSAAPDLVHLADMGEVGRNPGNIIPTWRAFVDSHPSAAVYGVGEPIPPGRAATELADYQQVESLLNIAFTEADDFLLRCPYDVGALDAAVLEEARRSHPIVVHGDRDEPSDTFEGADGVWALLDVPLAEPTVTPVAFTLRPGQLGQLRRFVADQARTAGLAPDRVDDLVLAANEIASNSLMYAGDGADVRVWSDGGVVCEIGDTGVLTDPLVGRVPPGAEEHDGRGLWIVHQLCDVVQVRSSARGSVVRLHMRP